MSIDDKTLEVFSRCFAVNAALNMPEDYEGRLRAIAQAIRMAVMEWNKPMEGK